MHPTFALFCFRRNRYVFKSSCFLLCRCGSNYILGVLPLSRKSNLVNWNYQQLDSSKQKYKKGSGSTHSPPFGNLNDLWLLLRIVCHLFDKETGKRFNWQRKKNYSEAQQLCSDNAVVSLWYRANRSLIRPKVTYWLDKYQRLVGFLNN